MIDSKLLLDHGVCEEDLKFTPPSVIGLIVYLISKIAVLEKRIEELEFQLDKDDGFVKSIWVDE